MAHDNAGSKPASRPFAKCQTTGDAFDCGDNRGAVSLDGATSFMKCQRRDVLRHPRHVRFTPKSGHVRCNSLCPLCASSGHSDTPYQCIDRAHKRALGRISVHRSCQAKKLQQRKKLTPSRAAISLLEGGILSFKEGKGGEARTHRNAYGSAW